MHENDFYFHATEFYLYIYIYEGWHLRIQCRSFWHLFHPSAVSQLIIDDTCTNWFWWYRNQIGLRPSLKHHTICQLSYQFCITAHTFMNSTYWKSSLIHCATHVTCIMRSAVFKGYVLKYFNMQYHEILVAFGALIASNNYS